MSKPLNNITMRNNLFSYEKCLFFELPRSLLLHKLRGPYLPQLFLYNCLELLS